MVCLFCQGGACDVAKWVSRVFSKGCPGKIDTPISVAFSLTLFPGTESNQWKKRGRYGWDQGAWLMNTLFQALPKTERWSGILSGISYHDGQGLLCQQCHDCIYTHD